VLTPLKWNQEKAVEDAKAKAAEIGATHIQITDVQRNIYNDAAVNATAYRCKK
jgi:argininosuccinate synthase